MLKAIKIAMKYAHLMDDIVDFIVLAQHMGRDGKMTSKERGRLLSASSKLIKKIQEAT